MPKLNFLDYLGKSVPKDRVRLMCSKMELIELETRLILERFCDNKTIEQCDFIPIDQQKTLLPNLIRKVRAWIQHNTAFFCLEELEGMVMYDILNDTNKTRIKQIKNKEW